MTEVLREGGYPTEQPVREIDTSPDGPMYNPYHPLNLPGPGGRSPEKGWSPTWRDELPGPCMVERVEKPRFSTFNEFHGDLILESLRAREAALVCYSTFLEAALLDSSARFRTGVESSTSEAEKGVHIELFNSEQGAISREIASNDIDLMSVRMQIRRAEAGR